MQRAVSWLFTIQSVDEDVRQRGRHVVILALSLVILASAFIPIVLLQPMNIAPIIGIIITADFLYLTVIFLARRGFVTAGALLFLATISIGVLSSIVTSSQLGPAPFFLILVVIAASLTLKPWQIWIVLGLILGGLLGSLLLLTHSPFNEPNDSNIIFASGFMLVVATIMCFLGAQSTAHAMNDTRQSRAAAESVSIELRSAKSNLETIVESRTADLQSALAEVQQHADAQERLLAELEEQRNTIRDLSVPVIPISATTLIMPLVGSLDSVRLENIQTQALHTLEHSLARHLIVDITGVPVVDSVVARGLVSVFRAAQLLGADVTLVGVRPEVAQSIVGLGIDLAGMHTARDLRSALDRNSVF